MALERAHRGEQPARALGHARHLRAQRGLLKLRVWLALALAGAACRSSIEVDGGAAYPCARDAGADACAPGWRCGLELRCHDQTLAAPYLCVSDTDCEQQWPCGPEGVCHDPSVGAALPCATDAQCGGGWHCGAEARCVSLAVPAPYPCRDDRDCSTGWRCGRALTCHDRSVPADYSCQLDDDCEGGWRCGDRGQCIALAAGPLSPAPFSTTVERVHPLYGPAALFSFERHPADGTLVAAEGAGVKVLRLTAPNVIDLGFVTATPFTARASVRDVLAIGSSGYLVTNAGIELAGGDAGPTQLLVPGAAGDSLRVLDNPARYLAVPTDDGGLFTLDRVSALAAHSDLVPAGGSPQRIDAITGGFNLCAFAATPAGMFVADLRSDGGGFVGDAGPLVPRWEPLPLDGFMHGSCGDGGTHRIVSIEPTFASNGPRLLVRAVSLDRSSGDQLAIISVRASAGPACASTLRCGTLTPIGGVERTCTPCDPGEALDDAFALSGVDLIAAHCRSPDGGHRTWQIESTCARTPLLTYYSTNTYAPLVDWTLRAHDRIDNNTSRVLGSAGGFLATPSGLRLLTPRRPTVVMQAGATTVFSSVSEGSMTVDGLGAIAGFSQSTSGPTLSAAITRNTYLATHGSLAYWLDTSSGAVVSRAVALGAAHSTAARLLNPSSGLSGLLTSYVDGLRLHDLDAGTTRQLGVPAPSLSVTSVAPVDPGGAEGPGAAAYVASAPLLNRVRSLGGSRIDFEPVKTTRGGFVTVWSQGGVGRAGLTSGEVVDLPSGLTLTEPLAPATVATAFASACGQTFVVAETGLWVATAATDGGALAAWQRVDLSPALDPQSLAGATLNRAADHLYVATARGGIVRLKLPQSCPGEAP